MGIPLRTGMCLDDAVHNLLVRAGVEFDFSEEDLPAQGSQFDVAHEASMDSSVESWAGLLKNVRSIQLDTGANGTFMYTNVEPFL